MSKQKYTLREDITIGKFKRVVRPLLTKIHLLNDLNLKNPSLFIITVNPLPRKSRKWRYNPKPVRRTKVVKRVTDSDPSNLEYTICTDTEELEKEIVEHDYSDKFSFKGLSSFISQELFLEYCEIFTIVKAIFNSLMVSDTFPSLSTLCSHVIGKEITKTTKTTFFKMNQTLLFDPETLPLSIRQYHHTLNDDIDGWFHLEPEDVYGKHRHDFYLGYLIHLLCVHKNVLYMLIPMVIQWLREEGYENIAQAMNYAFWQDTDVDLEVLNGNFLNKLGPFWQLYNIGYWNKFLNAGQLLSILHSKVNLQTFNAIENQNGLTRGHFLNIVYSLLKQDPQHPNINTILVTILTNIVHYTRSELARDDSVLEHTHDLTLEFASKWLAFVPDSESLYNSLYPENKILFLGLTNLCQYCYKNSSGKLGERFRNLKETINMLRIYYLCSNEQFEISSYKSIVKTLLTIQGPNVNIDEFLYWLEDTRHSELAQHLHIYDDSIIDDFNI